MGGGMGCFLCTLIFKYSSVVSWAYDIALFALCIDKKLFCFLVSSHPQKGVGCFIFIMDLHKNPVTNWLAIHIWILQLLFFFGSYNFGIIL